VADQDGRRCGALDGAMLQELEENVNIEVKEQAGSGYAITVAKTHDEVEALRPVWEELQFHPNTDIDAFLALVKARKEVIHPYVFFLSKGTSKTLVVGRLEEIRIGFSVGYLSFKLRARCLAIMHGGVLGDQSYENCLEIISQLCKALSDESADIVFINLFPVDSPLCSLGKARPNFFMRDHFSALSQHWQIALPESYEAFLKTISKTRRADLRNYSNRLAKAYGEKLSIKCFDREDSADALITDLDTVASKTYQRGVGSGFTNTPETRSRYKLALSKGWFRAYIMYLEEKPIAFWTGSQYRGTFFLEATAFDPDYKYYRPGTVLLMKAIELSYQDKSLEAIDFGFGDADYKQIYCNRSWQEASVYIFAFTPRGAMINCVHSLAALADSLGKRILARFNYVNHIKKLWRERLASGQKKKR
jgi:hypothetical protein